MQLRAVACEVAILRMKHINKLQRYTISFVELDRMRPIDLD